METSTPRSRFLPAAILGGVVAVLLGGYVLACHLLIQPDAFRTGLLKAITAHSGYVADARDAEVSVFPLPHIILHDLRIENAPDGIASNVFNAREVDIRLDPASLLRGQAVPVALTLESPDFELERYGPDSSNWQPFFKSGLAGMPSLQRVSIHSGTVVYSTGNDNNQEFKRINATWKAGSDGAFDVSGTLSGFNRELKVSVVSKTGRWDAPDRFSADIEAAISANKEQLQYRGTIGFAAPYGLDAGGHLDLAIDSVSDWAGRLRHDPAGQGMFDAMPKDLPVTLALDIALAKGHGQMRATAFHVGNSDGAVSLDWDATVSPHKASGALRFGTFDISQFLSGDVKEEQAINAFYGLLLPADVDAQLTANAAQMRYHDAVFEKVVATASLSGGEMVVNQASAQLPGNTRGFTFGIIKRDATGRVNYDGSAELLGDDVLAFVKGIGLDQANIIPATGQKFRAKADLFVAPRQGSISGLRFQAGDFQLSGGINFTPGGTFDTGITLLLRHAKLDPLLGLLVPVASTQTASSQINRKLPWLSDVAKKYAINLLFDDYTIASHHGGRSQVSGTISKDRIAIDTFDLHVDDVAANGRLDFRQNAEIPEIALSLNANRFDLTAMFAKHLVNHPVARGNVQNVWNNAKFDIDYLRGYSGKLALHIDQAIHPEFRIDNLSMTATVDNGDWNVSDLSGSIWGGQLKAKSHLEALSVPAVSTQFYLVNVQAEQMFDSMAGFQSLRGNTNISGEFSTSGVTPQDWARNMTGAMAFRGDQFVIRGFDLAGLVQTIPSVRLVADVVNTARVATLRGQSTFIVVEGSFYLQQGIMATKGITFRSRQAIGKFDGQLDLMRWMMDSGLEFKLITLASQDFPTLRLTFQDSMDNPVIGLDTRSLEAFVAQRKLE